jgi:hypothetical protein
MIDPDLSAIIVLVAMTTRLLLRAIFDDLAPAGLKRFVADPVTKPGIFLAKAACRRGMGSGVVARFIHC